ncbi:hypothetical protein M885DRAFT_205519 [Pelagophyceae sp. CCMP2097]|nr:hypothetical protein M885DRAFT_205519 [Pelagophyceae sp. CCMP2097]
MIKHIREVTKASMDVAEQLLPNATAQLAPTSERVVTICGEFGAVYGALALALRHLATVAAAAAGAENAVAPSASAIIDLTLLVPRNKTGGLIGRSGAAVNRVRQDSGATVKVASPEDMVMGEPDVRKCLISGTLDQVLAAFVLVMHKLEETPVGASRPPEAAQAGMHDMAMYHQVRRGVRLGEANGERSAFRWRGPITGTSTFKSFRGRLLSKRRRLERTFSARARPRRVKLLCASPQDFPPSFRGTFGYRALPACRRVRRRCSSSTRDPCPCSSRCPTSPWARSSAARARRLTRSGKCRAPKWTSRSRYRACPCASSPSRAPRTRSRWPSTSSRSRWAAARSPPTATCRAAASSKAAAATTTSSSCSNRSSSSSSSSCSTSSRATASR